MTIVTDPLVEVTTVEEFAAKVAAQIRTYGHYRGVHNTAPELRESHPAPCCLVAHYVRTPDWNTVEQFRQRFAKEAGATYSELIEFNDNHNTEEVLAILDSIAEGASA